MEDNKKILIASYGSLRLNQYNFERFKRLFNDGFNYVKTTSISGYKLFDLGSYPGLKVSSNEDDIVVVDVLEVSEDCFSYIEGMEHGAGYSTIKVTDKEGDKYFAYLYEYPCNNLVESGDWSKYLEQEEAVRI